MGEEYNSQASVKMSLITAVIKSFFSFSSLLRSTRVKDMWLLCVNHDLPQPCYSGLFNNWKLIKAREWCCERFLVMNHFEKSSSGYFWYVAKRDWNLLVRQSSSRALVNHSKACLLNFHKNILLHFINLSNIFYFSSFIIIF